MSAKKPIYILKKAPPTLFFQMNIDFETDRSIYIK